MGSMGHMDRNASMGRTSSKLGSRSICCMGSTSRSISSLSTSSVGSRLEHMRQLKLALAWPPPSLVILRLI